MDKSKIGFIAAAAVLVVAAAGLGFLAKTKFDKAAEARSARDGSISSLDRIYKQEVFPNAENVAALADVLKEFEQGREAMTNVLAKSNVGKSAPGEISPSAFQSKLSAGLRRLHEIAPLVDGRKSVADGFAFGFDAYYGKDAMPKEDEVPLLVQQLGMTALLVREIYGAQVSQLLKIEREARDSETLATQKDSARRDSGEEEEDSRTARQKKGKKSEPERAQLFSGQKMALEFTARQNALIDLLNRLNAMPKPFVVVRSVSAKKTGGDLRKPPAPEAPASETSPRRERRPERERQPRRERRAGRRGQEEESVEEVAPPPPPAAPKPSEMPAEMRVVSGPDVDPPLSVRIELEIFNFGEEVN